MEEEGQRENDDRKPLVALLGNDDEEARALVENFPVHIHVLVKVHHVGNDDNDNYFQNDDLHFWRNLLFFLLVGGNHILLNDGIHHSGHP
jgi:hypothetical protein